MDIFDIKLLNALQADGRLTNYDLSEKVGLSASQCSRRRQALEESGVIASYCAHLSAEAVDLQMTVFVHVRLNTHSPDNSRNFQGLIARLVQVQEAYSLTGESDYLLKLVVTDLKALSHLLNDVFLPHESVAHVRSSVVLDRLKETSVLPLDHLVGRDAGITIATKSRSPRRRNGAAKRKR